MRSEDSHLREIMASPPAIFTARPTAARRVPVHLRLVCAWNWLNGYEWAAADTAGANLTAFWTYYEEWTVRLENPTRPVLLPPCPPRRTHFLLPLLCCGL